MHIWGKGRAAGRVGSDFLSAIAGRVGSGRVGSTLRRVGSGRVREKWPVDNSEVDSSFFQFTLNPSTAKGVKNYSPGGSFGCHFRNT